VLYGQCDLGKIKTVTRQHLAPDAAGNLKAKWSNIPLLLVLIQKILPICNGRQFQKLAAKLHISKSFLNAEMCTNV